MAPLPTATAAATAATATVSEGRMADGWRGLRRRLPGPQDNQGRPRGEAAGDHIVFRQWPLAGVRPLEVRARNDVVSCALFFGF